LPWRARFSGANWGNPAFEKTNCTTIDQMKLVNAYCRAIQDGTTRVQVEVGV
jgi:hypothetical protein